MSEQTTEQAAQTVPETGDSSAADSPTILMDTVTSEATESKDGQQTPTLIGGENTQAQDTSSWTFEVPQGTEIDVGSMPVRALGDAAAQQGLSNEQAQQVLNQVGPAFTQHYQQLHQQMMEQWAEDTRNDPHIGGTRLQQSLTEAKQAFATFDPDGQALEVLTQWGLVNHPAILRFAQRARSAVSDGRFIAGTAKAAQPQHTARQHFPGSNLND